MNLTPLATAALLMIGIAQVSQAWTVLQPTPQETHVRVVQEFCKKQAQKSAYGEQIYVDCMAELTSGKRLRG